MSTDTALAAVSEASRPLSGPASRLLLLRCRQGDDSAWAELVRRYERLVFSVALAEGLGVEDAADVSQTVFEALLASLDRLREDGSVSAWLVAVARRQAWRVRDRRRREEPLPDAADHADLVVAPGLGSDAAADVDRALWLHDGLAELGEPCSSLLAALYFDPSEPSYAEVALRLRRPVGSIGPTRARCLQRLRSVLLAEKLGVSAAAGQPPTMEEILDWVEGRMPPEQQRAMIARVAGGGAETARLVAWVREFLDESAHLRLVAPPPLVSQRLKRLAARRAGRTAPIERLVAEPVLDSRQAGRLAGVRAPAPAAGTRFQMTYRADDVAVVLDVARTGDTVTIRGQVLPERETLPVFEATAVGPFGAVTSILGDELGGFLLPEIPADTQALMLTNDEIVIELPTVLASGPAREPG